MASNISNISREQTPFQEPPSLKGVSNDIFQHVISYLDFKSVVNLLDAMLIKNVDIVTKRSLAYFDVIERGVEKRPLPFLKRINMPIFYPNARDTELFCKRIRIAARTKKVFRQLDLSKYDLTFEAFNQILNLESVVKTTNIKLRNFKNLSVDDFEVLAGTLETLHLTRSELTSVYLEKLSKLTSLTMPFFFFTEELRSLLATKLPNLTALNLKDDYKPIFAPDSVFVNVLSKREGCNGEDHSYLPSNLNELTLSFGPGLFQSDNLSSLPNSLTTFVLIIKDPKLAIDSSHLPKRLTTFTFTGSLLAEDFFKHLPTSLEHLSVTTSSDSRNRPNVILENCCSLKSFQFTNNSLLNPYGSSTDWLLNLPESLIELTIDEMSNLHIERLPKNLTRLQARGLRLQLDEDLFERLPRTLTCLDLTMNESLLSKEKVKELLPNLLILKLKEKENNASDVFGQYRKNR